jgi:Uma2 family endonuclease
MGTAALHQPISVRDYLRGEENAKRKHEYVVCRPNPPTDAFHDAPVVIVEVVCPSTRRTDENEKCEAYLSIDSLCVYILAESSAAAALVYRRGESGFERESYLGLDAVIPLPEIACELRLADLYENVQFPAPPPDDEGDG